MDTTVVEAADMHPLVSVVTPVKNGARYLSENLASIREQSYPHIEQIVVDGVSTDATLDVLRAQNGLRWLSEPDEGLYDAINKGFRLAKGEILAYQNSDDRYIVPHAVSLVVEQMVARPEVDVLYGTFRYIDELGRPCPRSPLRGRRFCMKTLRRYNCIPAHATFVRRRVVWDEGHWLDPNLVLAGDWDWMLRMAGAGKNFLCIDAVLAEFRLHDLSKTRTLPWRIKLAEWRRLCLRHRASFLVLLWNELFWQPVRQRWSLYL